MSLILAKLSEALAGGPIDTQKFQIQRELERLANERQDRQTREQRQFQSTEAAAGRDFQAGQNELTRKQQQKQFDTTAALRKAELDAQEKRAEASRQLQELNTALGLGQLFGNIPEKRRADGTVEFSPIIPPDLATAVPGVQGIARASRSANEAAQQRQAGLAAAEGQRRSDEQFFDAIAKMDPAQSRGFLRTITELGLETQLPGRTLVIAAANASGTTGGLDSALSAAEELSSLGMRMGMIRAGVNPDASFVSTNLPPEVYETARAFTSSLSSSFEEEFGPEIANAVRLGAFSDSDFDSAFSSRDVGASPLAGLPASDRSVYQDFLNRIQSGEATIEQVQLTISELRNKQSAGQLPPQLQSVDFNIILQLLNSQQQTR